MSAKNVVQLHHHGSVIRVAFGGRKGTAPQAPAQTIPIQNLFVRQVARLEMVAAEKTADMMHLRVSIFHALVVDAEAFEQLLVFPSEALLFHAPVIPGDDDPAGRLQDAEKFASRAVWFEPVEGLAGGDKVDAGIDERGGFGRALHAGEAVVGGEIFLAGPAHFGIWLDTVNAIAIPQE